jgi:F-type H+-transporting ATPase subunit b
LKVKTPQLRSSARIHRFVLLTFIVAGLATVPSRLASLEHAASTPAPAAAGQSSQSPDLSAQPSQVKHEEEEEHAVYLHTPMVAAIGKVLHLSVETTANILLSINSAIIILAIGIPLAKFLPKVMRKRNLSLSHSLEEARKTTTDANTRLKAVEDQLSRLDEEIAKIRAQVEEESKHEEARIKATIEEESARIVASAEQEISAAAAQATRGLRHYAADLAIEQAARQLILTPETDRALIAEFIRDAQDGAAAGGKN